MPRTRRDRKTVTSRIVTTADINRVIDGLLDAWVAQHLSYDTMVNYLGFTLFGAYTGQRVEATISRITVAQMRTALHATPSILLVSPIQDKIRMEHYVPLHPDLHHVLTKMIENKARQVPGVRIRWISDVVKTQQDIAVASSRNDVCTFRSTKICGAVRRYHQVGSDEPGLHPDSRCVRHRLGSLQTPLTRVCLRELHAVLGIGALIGKRNAARNIENT